MTRPRGFATYMEWDRGFRGWLVLWFVTAVGALVAHVVNLVQVGRMNAVWWSTAGRTAWLFKAMAAVDAVWGIGVFVALVYGIALFLREDPATPHFWARYYIVVAVLGCVLYLAHAYRTAFWRGEPMESVLTGWGWWRAASGTVLPVAWALYWVRSKRVRNTYNSRAFSPTSGDRLGAR